MRKSLLTSVFFLLAFLNCLIAQAQTAAAPCVQSDQCFDFAYSYLVNSNGTVTIKFDVTVNCDRDLSNVAFQLPAGATASAYSGPGQVENPTNNPFYSIKFNTNAGGKNGAVRSFSYTVSAAAFATMTTIKAHAKASTTVGQVTFNRNCGGVTPPPVSCTLSADVAGPASVCPSAAITYNYSTSLQAGATYNWSVPAGWSIVSGQNTHTILVKANSNAAAGNIAVSVSKNGCTAASDVLAVAISNNCGTTPPPVTGPCVQTDKCFEFKYAYVINANGTVTIKFDVTTNCQYDLSNVAFQLPAGATASAYTGPGQVENPTNNPFYSIKFDGQTGKNGTVRSFSYTITAAQFATMTTIKAHAKAGQIVGQVTFTKTGCGPVTPPPCPIAASIAGPDTVCVFNDEPYTFTTPAQANAAYVWEVPADWAIESGEGTNAITVFAGEMSGTVKVTVSSSCGTATDSQYVFADETCGFITPLPVKLIAFEGAASKAGIVLNWATAAEKDNDRFEVQRSADGKTFETIGTVKGSGTVNTRISYSFTDAKASSSNYYRLRQVDFDGRSEMSKVIRVHAAGRAAGMKLYPNPVTGGRFTLALDQAANATVVISDMNGRQVHAAALKAGQLQLEIETQKLGMKPGIYLVTVKDGNQAQAQKLSVQ